MKIKNHILTKILILIKKIIHNNNKYKIQSQHHNRIMKIKIQCKKKIQILIQIKKKNQILIQCKNKI